MAKTTLVAPDIDEGRVFLDLLDHSAIPVSAALWQKVRETDIRLEGSGEWDFVVVTPLVEEIGVRETYRRIDKVLSKASRPLEVGLLNISVFTPESWYAKSLRKEFRGARDLTVRNRLVMGSHFIEEGYVYFVK